MVNDKFVKLGSILDYYSLVVPDTSVIVGHIEKSVNGEKSNLRDYSFWKKYIVTNSNAHKILFHEDVCGELDNCFNHKFADKKSIAHEIYANKSFKRFISYLDRLKSRKDDFLKKIKKENLILKFNEKEKDLFLYFHDRFKCSLDSDAIGEVDYNLFISSLVLTQTRCNKKNKLAFISNDSDLLEVGETIISLNPNIKHFIHLYRRFEEDSFLRKR